jgi:hypothetical protein
MTTLKRWNGTDWEYVGLPVNAGTTPQTLGYAERTDASPVAIAGPSDLLSVTVTVPEGRRLKVSAFICMSLTATNAHEVSIRMDGIQLNRSYSSNVAAGQITSPTPSWVVSPSAGTHTFTFRWNSGAGTMYSDIGNETMLLVEDITGSTLPYNATSIPVGQIGFAENTSNSAVIGTAETAPNVPNVNVVVPAGRLLKITAHLSFQSYTGGAVAITRIYQDSTSMRRDFVLPTTISSHAVEWSWTVSPSAGAHLYGLSLAMSSGTVILQANSFIRVEDITPTPAPANTALSSALAYAEVIADQTSISSIVDLTNLSVTVTVPAGRRLRITGHAQIGNDATAGMAYGQIKEGSTALGRWAFDRLEASSWTISNGSIIVSPSAGTHTYKLTLEKWGGAGSIYLDAQTEFPAYILVEDITGVGVAGHTHTQLDDTGWISLVPYLVNGWLSYDNTYGPPRFRKKNGWVSVQGLVKNGTIGNIIATLPVGFRTSGIPKLLFSVNANDGDTGGSRVDVDTSGNIIHIGSRNTYYSLSGIIYPVD